MTSGPDTSSPARSGPGTPGRNAARLGKNAAFAVKAAAGLGAVPLGVALVFDRAVLWGVYVQGASIGSLYGLIALGLVLVHRSTGIINFAQASMGSVPATLAILLMAAHGVPWPIAVVVLIVVAAGSGAAVDGLVIQRFRTAPRLILAVATIGVAQVFAFVELFLPRWVSGDRNPLQRASAIRSPLSGIRGELGGVVLSGDHLLAVLVVCACALGLGIFFQRTTIGLSIRAAADNADRAWLLGVPVRRVSTVVWVLAALLSAAGVFLRVPLVGSLPGGGLIGASTLLFALAPAVIARMEHFGVALVAAIGLGMLDQAVFFATSDATISGALILPVVLGALLVQRRRGGRAHDTGIRTWRELREARPTPPELRRLPEVRALRIGSLVIVGVVAIALPYLVGDTRQDFATLMVVYAMVGLSLVILTGWAGQISLGQFAFVGVGAAVAGALVADAGWDFTVAVPIGAAAGALVAVVVGLPALRLPGLLLAVTTLAFAANTQFLVLNHTYAGWMLPEQVNLIDRPVLWGRIDATSDAGYYHLCLVLLVITATAVAGLRRRRTGRLLVAGRDNERGVQAVGVEPTRARLGAFAVSGAIAGLAGGLLAHLQGVVDAAVFTPERSLQLFAMTVIGGLTSVGGAFAGAAYLATFQFFLPDYQLLASGAGMLVLLMFFPGGLSEALGELRNTVLRRIADRRGLVVPSLVADVRTGGAEELPLPPTGDERTADETTADEPVAAEVR